MPGLSPIQPAFLKGETSPRSRARVDLESFKYGLEFCENFQPTPQGSILMRGGSEHVLEIAGADSRVRLIQLRVLSGQDYLAILLNNLMRVYAITGAQASPEDLEASELVQNGTFDAGATGWTIVTTGGGSVGTTGAATLATVNAQTAAIKQTVHLNAPADLVFSFATSSISGGSKVRVRIGTSDGGSQLLDWLGSSPPAQFMLPAVPAGDIFIQVSAVAYYYGLVNGSQLYLCVITVDNISLHAPFEGTQQDIVTPWSADEVRDVQFVAETAADRIIFVHPNHAPQYLSRNPVTGSWAFGPVVFTPAAPVEWTGTNWPSVVEIHGGRAYYAATPAERNRVWATDAGSTSSFTVSNPITAGDRLDFKVATKGGFRWMQGNRVLLAGSDLGEHSISGSNGNIPVNGDIQSRRESGFGSCAKIQAVDAGDKAVFVSSDRRKIRALAYDLRTSGWEAEDLTFDAEHITADLIRELHHVFTPDGTFVALLESGKFVMGTTVPKLGVAFWRMPLSSGTVCSAACSRGDAGAFVWLAVQREAKVYLERLPLSENAVRWYLDAAVEATADANGAVAVEHITGSVRVVSDGVLVGDYEVAAGVIQLGADYADADVVAGTPYVATATTLPVEGGNPQGTSQGLVIHWSEIVARLNNSARPRINGERASGNKPFGGDLDTLETLVTADVQVAGSEVSSGGRVTVTQDAPYRTEICGLFGQAEVSRV